MFHACALLSVCTCNCTSKEHCYYLDCNFYDHFTVIDICTYLRISCLDENETTCSGTTSLFHMQIDQNMYRKQQHTRLDSITVQNFLKKNTQGLNLDKKLYEPTFCNFVLSKTRKQKQQK